MNFYEILGVPADCSGDQLRQKYHQLLLASHPDKAPSQHNRFEQIQQAYRTLSDAEARQKYDRELQRAQLHNLPHATIPGDEQEYICRCGTVLDIAHSPAPQLIECPNCSTKVQVD